MDHPLARKAIPLDPQRVIRPEPYANPDQGDAFSRWQAHVDAGRIGNRLPTPPDVAANRDATTALFRDIARDRHRARRGW